MESNNATSPLSPKAPLLIENVFEKETSESFVEQHFRKGALHRAKDAAEFDLDAVAAEFGESLVRSTQELVPNPDGKGCVPQWVSMIYQRPGDLFWHFVAKSANYGQSHAAREFTLTVTSSEAKRSAADALMLRSRFVPSDSTPGFFYLKEIRNPRRMPVKEEYLLNDADLALHYGEDFVAWTAAFSAGLNQNGLSILRGKPGTGKTSFLRHLICKLCGTHRFYYVPTDGFGMLMGGLPEFLAREKSRNSDAVLVVVMEDAEQLLLERRGARDGLAASLLNFADGFVGDMVSAHLVCTINSEARELDEAVLRPGRQRFFHEFDLIPWERAQKLGERLGVTLTESRKYSLAELYHFKDTQSAHRLKAPSERPIGFVH
jgi:hypothetical protein